ncbi:MAG: LamG domain-containing protein, partial [Candidatus Marinimicrobia bacterium]|nr:LamG domain-containing protein [Candidatus Neomarinimicrobiota bacterium]
ADSTTLAALNTGVFSLEIRAAGETLPAGVVESPTLFMIGNDQVGKLGVYRDAADSSRIRVRFKGRRVGGGSLFIPGCDWNDPDRFTQVVVTYDLATVRVYGNGSFLGSLDDTEGINIGDSDALIGADWNTPDDVSDLDQFWYGAIDEVRLWTRVLPANEMEFRYKNPKNLTRFYSADGLDPLLGLWRFNEKPADGVTVPDRSGKGNDAVIFEGAGRFYFIKEGA